MPGKQFILFPINDMSNQSIRLATPADIPRTAFVAAAGFYHSPVSAFERPKRDKYPRDTVANYRHELFEFLWDSNRALFVVEDEYDKHENKEIYRSLDKAFGNEDWPKINGKIIVGFLCLTFKPGSSRIGKYQPDGNRPDFKDIEDSERDQDNEGVKLLSDTLKGPVGKHLAVVYFRLSMIAVHPMYWRRGHGTSLLKLATKWADEDGIHLGLVSVPMGLNNAKKVGFKEREVVEVPGYSRHPESFSLWVMVREPNSGS